MALMEFLVLRRKLQIVNRPGQVPGHLQIGFEECAIDEELGGYVRKLRLFPGLDLRAHAFKVPLQNALSIGEKCLECLASTGWNTPETMFPTVGSQTLGGDRGQCLDTQFSRSSVRQKRPGGRQLSGTAAE
jgi:hypothetical protein